MVATEPFVGRPVLRKEDPELITGEAQYIDNWTMPGMVMAAASYLKENPAPTEEEVRESLEGNLCRCTGYQNIVKSILDAAGQLSGAKA